MENKADQAQNIANAANQRVGKVEKDVAKLGNRVQNLEQRIDSMEKRYDRGIATAGAIGLLPQPHVSGKSMFAASVANYRAQQAIAVGYSRLSNNGKHILKLSASSNVSGKKMY
ncbi:YadA domain-containing protein [Actinobacillus equuli]|nr:YadA domain-containing protein [Actinobacillus equuli]